MINKALRDEVLLKVSLSQVTGSNARRIQCPFHNSTDKDMVLYHGTNRWRCMGVCDDSRTHTVIEWVMYRDGVNYGTALQELANMAGIGDLSGERQDILMAAARAWKAALPKEPKALKYLASRGIGEQLWSTEPLGYAAGVRALLDVDLTYEQLSLVGLAGRERARVWPHYTEHIVLPIRDHKHRLLQVQGRFIGPAEKAVAKYLALPQNVDLRGPNIQDMLGNAENVKPGQSLWLAEGFFDRLTLTGLDMKAVNLFGHSNLAAHAFSFRNLKRLNVILDPDEASQKRLLEELYYLAVRIPGVDIRVVLLPEGEDVNGWALSATKGEAFDYLLHSHLVEELEEMSEKAPTLIENLIEDWGNKVHERLRMAELIGAQQDEERWVQTFAKKLDVDTKSVQFLVDSCRTYEGENVKAKPKPKKPFVPRKEVKVLDPQVPDNFWEDLCK